MTVTAYERHYGETQGKARAALRDLVEGLREWGLWTALGWLDVKQRYRRAILGPFWITISMAVMVLALGVIYGGIFRQNVHDFLPYLAGGFIFWNFFSSTITESTTTFVQAEGLIKQGGIPLSLHVFRSVFRNLVVGAHNLTVMLLIYAWQPSLLSWTLVLVIPGVLLILANLTWIATVVGILCTRFRDLPPIISSLLQIVFFISPIMYRRDTLPEKLHFIVAINPVYYFAEVVRAPLMGSLPSVKVYLLLMAFAIIGWALTFRFFKTTRPRVPYWI